jgi:hypothetical protein
MEISQAECCQSFNEAPGAGIDSPKLPQLRLLSSSETKESALCSFFLLLIDPAQR